MSVRVTLGDLQRGSSEKNYPAICWVIIYCCIFSKLITCILLGVLCCTKCCDYVGKPGENKLSVDKCHHTLQMPLMKPSSFTWILGGNVVKLDFILC